MSVTVWGNCGGEGQTAAHYDRGGWLLEAHSYRKLELALPDDGVPIDADHDHQPLGQLIYAEIDNSDRLNVVAVLDDDAGEQLAEVAEEGPVFLSAELLMIGPDIDKGSVYVADRAELRSVALTFTPAVLGARPLHWRRGDLRRSLDRHSIWPSGWKLDEPLLARALEHLDGPRFGIETRTASSIVDRRRASSPLLERYGSYGEDGLDYSKLGPGRKPYARGGVEYSVHPGRILSVR